LTLKLEFVSYPAVNTLLSPFKVTITPSCRTDTFSNFSWNSNNSATISQFDYKISTTQDFSFNSPSNALASECSIKFYLFLLNTTTSQYELQTANPNFGFDNVANPSLFRISSTTADLSKD
jgi:hypothetical protein